MMQVGADLRKVRKSKSYPRIYKLDSDLLGILWNSRSKKGNRARSKSIRGKGSFSLLFPNTNTHTIVVAVVTLIRELSGAGNSSTQCLYVCVCMYICGASRIVTR